MLSRGEIQTGLPAELIPQQSRTVHPCQGQLFDAQDRRLGDDQTEIRRVIRIIECDAGAVWRSPWLKSIKDLSECRASRVCRPLEVGWIDGKHCYLVFDWFPTTLATQISAIGGRKSIILSSIFEQLTSSLAQLHSSFGPHGDLRLENIFLDTQQLGEQTHPWIGHTDLCLLPELTKGELLCPDSRKIFPPEWNGELQKPSQSADVYALGLIAIELHLGRQALEGFRKNGRLLPSQQRRLGWANFQWCIKPMLASDPKIRLNDASAVQQRIRAVRRLKRTAKFGVAFAVIMAIAGLFVWQAEKKRGVIAAEMATLETKLQGTEAALIASKRSAEPQGPEGPVPPNAAAQRVWEKNLAAFPSLDLSQVLASMIRDAEPGIKEDLIGFRKRVEDRRADWSRWESSQPAELVQPWADFVKHPWDDDRSKNAAAQLTALQEAECVWWKVICRQTSDWKKFKEDLKDGADGSGSSVHRIVSRWIDQFNAFTEPGKRVAILLKSGTSPKGSGKFRTVDVHVAGSLWALDDETGHDWGEDAAHAYAPELPITFPWQPDQSIQFKMFGERQTLRAGARPLYIDKTFQGPVALWELGRNGSISSGSHSIEIEVKDLPGPPPIPGEIARARLGLAGARIEFPTSE